MAIVTSKLIMSPTLQDILIDKTTGEPLSAGVVTCYHDSNRTVLKNWYSQTGTASNYTFIPLPNPMTLSGVGTIVDVNGNDTIPFFYPWLESDNTTSDTYYITVDDANGTRQFIRQNFPFNPNAASPSTLSVPTLKNYIVNNNFWRNAEAVNLTNQTSYVVAPSQHSGFSMPDMTFIKNVNGAVDNVSFVQFGLGDAPWTNDTRPEYYLNHVCSAPQAGETTKCYQFPVSFHIRTLDSVNATITIQAKNNNGNPNNRIKLLYYQFCGTTGGSATVPVQIGNDLVLTPSWQKYTISFTFPSAQGLTLSQTEDDAMYIRIQLPITTTCDIDFAIPSLYLGTEVPTDNFTTYDETDAIINSPRTGDIKTTINSFGATSPQNFGWVPLNDQTIGALSPIPSGATTRENNDTWQLYNLLWTNVNNTYAPVSSGRGASAYADFIAGKTITLTQTLGKVIAGNWDNSPNVLGYTTGSNTHTMTTPELATHTHGFNYSNGGSVSASVISDQPAGGHPAIGTGASGPNATVVIANTGSSTPFNIMQPTVFYNMLIKL